MTAPETYLRAARCPDSLKPQKFHPWEIARLEPKIGRRRLYTGWPSYTVLYRHTKVTWANLHLDQPSEIVMEDSKPELRQHLPIWLKGRGRILVTGLGLGCVVRGLLANPDVERIDVIEIDRGILDVIGPEFAGEDRVNLIHGDALKHPINGEWWDFAWHDIWVDEACGRDLQLFHADLIAKFMSVCGPQGAWKLPRFMARLAPAISGLR